MKNQRKEDDLKQGNGHLKQTQQELTNRSKPRYAEEARPAVNTYKTQGKHTQPNN